MCNSVSFSSITHFVQDIFLTTKDYTYLLPHIRLKLSNCFLFDLEIFLVIFLVRNKKNTKTRHITIDLPWFLNISRISPKKKILFDTAGGKFIGIRT